MEAYQYQIQGFKYDLDIDNLVDNFTLAIPVNAKLREVVFDVQDSSLVFFYEFRSDKGKNMVVHTYMPVKLGHVMTAHPDVRWKYLGMIPFVKVPIFLYEVKAA